MKTDCHVQCRSRRPYAKLFSIAFQWLMAEQRIAINLKGHLVGPVLYDLCYIYAVFHLLILWKIASVWTTAAIQTYVFLCIQQRYASIVYIYVLWVDPRGVKLCFCILTKCINRVLLVHHLWKHTRRNNFEDYVNGYICCRVYLLVFDALMLFDSEFQRTVVMYVRVISVSIWEWSIRQTQWSPRTVSEMR